MELDEQSSEEEDVGTNGRRRSQQPESQKQTRRSQSQGERDSRSPPGGRKAGSSPIGRRASLAAGAVASSLFGARKEPIADASFGELVVDKRARSFATDVASMRLLIRQRQRYLFHPNKDRWLPWFDMLVGFCVLFITVVSPVDITMKDETTFSMVYAMGLICNAIFFCDFLVRLNRVYRDKRSLGGRWVKDRRRIFTHYLRGWFAIDLLSSIPFDLPFALKLVEEGERRRRDDH